MTDSAHEFRRRKAWLGAAVIAAVIGGAAAVSFAAWWFAEVRGHCGVVRFYEQAFGVILVGGWLAGTAAGLLIARGVGRRTSDATAIGSIVAILANVAVVVVCALVVHGVREGDYSLKRTDELLGFLAGDDLDSRKLAAHALGERRAVEALPPFCAILDDARQDVNLRHNAAIGLGKICAPPRRAGVDVDRALGSLMGALGGEEQYLPNSIARALGDIGDPRAVGPLQELLNDGSRPVYAREDAARALGRIAGEEACAALERALPGAGDESLTRTILGSIEASKRSVSAGSRP